jgi:hypothetical protein
MELQDNFQMHMIKENRTMFTLSLIVFVIVCLLLLTAFAGIGAGPRKKNYCPFCGRKIGSAKECPYCGEKVA